MTDYRGSNMSAMAEAHRKAHAADTQNDIAPHWSLCGLQAGDQMKCKIPISKLLLCSRCQGVQYCSKVRVGKTRRWSVRVLSSIALVARKIFFASSSNRLIHTVLIYFISQECQINHWPEHKVHCKQMTKERKAQEKANRELQQSDIQKQIYALADEYQDDLSGQAKAFIDILAAAKDYGMTAVACAHRLGEDLGTFDRMSQSRRRVLSCIAFLSQTGSCRDSATGLCRKSSFASIMAYGHVHSSLRSWRGGIREGKQRQQHSLVQRRTL